MNLPSLTAEMVALLTAYHIFQCDKNWPFGIYHIDTTFPLPTIESEHLTLLEHDIPYMCINCVRYVGTVKVATVYQCHNCPNSRHYLEGKNFSSLIYSCQNVFKKAGYTRTQLDYVLAIYLGKLAGGHIKYDEWKAFVDNKLRAVYPDVKVSTKTNVTEPKGDVSILEELL